MRWLGLGLAALAALCLPTVSAGEFDFKDPKGVNAMTFVLDSEVEPIMGVATGVSGTIAFDPANPAQTGGRLEVETTSLITPNDGMTKTLHGPDWLDAKANPSIAFVVREVEKVEAGPNQTWELTLAGDFTCKGITKPLKLKVRATYLEGKLSSRVRGREGDLLILRTEFTINRKDFDIKPNEGGVVVAETIEVRASIVGASAKK